MENGNLHMELCQTISGPHLEPEDLQFFLLHLTRFQVGTARRCKHLLCFGLIHVSDSEFISYVYLCVCVCVYICMYVCMYIYIYVYIGFHIRRVDSSCQKFRDATVLDLAKFRGF